MLPVISTTGEITPFRPLHFFASTTGEITPFIGTIASESALQQRSGQLDNNFSRQRDNSRTSLEFLLSCFSRSRTIYQSTIIDASSHLDDRRDLTIQTPTLFRLEDRRDHTVRTTSPYLGFNITVATIHLRRG